MKAFVRSRYCKEVTNGGHLLGVRTDSCRTRSTRLSTRRLIPPYQPNAFRSIVGVSIPLTRIQSTSLKQSTSHATGEQERPPLKVLIAGAGIGGLVLAVGLIKKGFQVTIITCLQTIAVPSSGLLTLILPPLNCFRNEGPGL